MNENLPRHLGLGVLISLNTRQGMWWDFFHVKLGCSHQIIWAARKLAFVPAVDEPLIISPLNWFFVQRWSGYILQRLTINNTVFFKPKIRLIFIDARLRSILLKRRLTLLRGEGMKSSSKNHRDQRRDTEL